ncbi:MAG TPA: SHOCT domain-containing protein [Gemmatimonadaceae bacterium]
MTPTLVIVQQPWWCPMCRGGMGWGWGMMVIATLVWLAALGLLVALVWWLITARRSSGGRPDESRDAEEILRERYASGDIDRATYQRMRDDLQRRPGL